MRNATLVRRKFNEFFLPTILMSASASLSLIIDSVIVGNILGDSELAAVNLIIPLSLCFTAISAMFGIGSSICISVFKGKMDSKNANRCLTLSVIAWIFFSIASIFICLTSSSAIAAFLSGNSGLDNLVYDYLKIYLLGSPFTFATLIFPHIIKADGLPKLSSNALIAANATNLAMDIVYMKFLNLGIGGAALATITGNAVGTLLYCIYIKSKKKTLCLSRLKLSDLKMYVDMFKMSISSIFGQGLMFAKMWVFNMVVANTSGQAGLTAFSICTSCLSFVSMFIAGGAQTMMPMVGAFSGAEDNTAIKYTTEKAFRLVIGCCIAITVLFELFPSVIMSVYGITGGAVMEIGKNAIRLFSLSFVFTGFSFMFMYYVQAKKMPAFAMQICALDGFIIIVPTGILLASLLGNNGIWLSYVANGILVAMFIIIKSRYAVKKSKGALYSLFMLKSETKDYFETTVDVSDEKATENAIKEISDMVNKENTAQILEYMFELSKCAYRKKKGLKKGDTVDVILTKDKLTFKDMGTDYRLLEDNGYIERIQEYNRHYENTLMIGMNYSAILLE